MKQATDPELGDLVKDRITGLEGIVTCRSDWFNGCTRFLIQPQALHDGKPIDSQWFDAEQLEVVQRCKIRPPWMSQLSADVSTRRNIQLERTGGDRPAPQRAKDPVR